ncbi:MAG: diguanylate cyclase [Deltaproteobacteria bacterium]|nr:diguanylate cyclase [Deltaproteobacteria bacterium]MBW1909002.1 diguanylate cyclase [Deltaproteobacteria bacterium]MBW2033097.1 diguanylate cyclase [Deltaproteobacteria bacterium]MBW2113744.1 diguanylate cyclase [Deltaproteobacteria bacterium]
MKVLIAEDNLVSRRLLETFLRKWGYDIVITSNGREAWEVLQEPEAPNLVISDWMMPDMDGLELCRRIREMERAEYIYFIILTSKGKKEDVITGLEAGADDYLIKPFNQDELKYRVKIGERIIELERRILRLASTDSLTEVLNRRAFMERMEQEINRSFRENSPLSLILADIDHFKSVNDRHGHQVGDLVLQRFVSKLTESSRPYDFVGRYGGEEFVICLPGATGTESRTVAERMRKSVEEMKIMLPESSQSVRITASFGVVTLRLELEDSMDSLIGRADDAMYMAKREGRNRVCAAGEE